MSNATQELQDALTSQRHLLAWFSTRGYRTNAAVALPEPRKDLQGFLPLHAPQHPQAPRFFFLWRDDFSERSTKGKKLRQLQQHANDYCEQHRTDPQFANDIPELFALGCPDFLLFFRLDGDIYARRLRFSPALLQRGGTSLLDHYQSLDAATMATFAVQATASTTSNDDVDDFDDFFDDLLTIGEEGRTQYDFSKLFIGEQLDEDFVALMAMERRELLNILLQPERRDELLVPILTRLKLQGTDWGKANTQSDGYPDLEHIIKRADIRSRLIATVDTVLLRVILYRYLEAQFGYQADDAETNDYTFGTTFDEIIEQTTQVTQAQVRAVTQQAATQHKGDAALTKDAQLGLFGDSCPAEVHDAEGFTFEVKERNDYYQRQAGGDLHHGPIADAANFLQAYLLDHHTNGVAALLVVTSSERYSFAYADLDPRAFQRFYENTIGTDIRFVYQPHSGDAHVDVVLWHQNRKEQGAYFTNERICKWLVERSLGRLYDTWLHELRALLPQLKSQQTGRLHALRDHLDALLAWKILDPTMGGGIFLRTAFEFLSNKQLQIAELLQSCIPQSLLKQLFDDPRYELFRPNDEQQGEWQWYVLLHMLYGVDVDIKAVNIASNLLTLSSLIYKPHGVCFPSFINTNLKRGNALVIPMAPGTETPFARTHQSDIRALLQLRRQLRDPSLSREQWKDTHLQANEITETITDKQILSAYKSLFKGESKTRILDRVHQTGVFLYEIEFPEVFFNDDGMWLDNPGFDVILGNPPWEEPAAELKHFLPEFDPSYRELSGPASIAREQELLADKEIATRWDTFQLSIDDFKRLIKSSGWYQHQAAKVRGRKQGAHSNLYKYAAELAYHYLKEGGFTGMLLDGGLWNDLSATGVRRLLIDNCDVQEILGFVNHKGIFPDVHRSYKFACNIWEKGGETQQIPLIFMREELDDLDRFEALSFPIEADVIRQNPSETYAIPEVQSKLQLSMIVKINTNPVLWGPPWDLDSLSEEFNAGRARKQYFHEAHEEGYYPLIQGKEFNLFGVHQGELPAFWLDPSLEEGAAGRFLYDKQRGRVLKAIADWLAAQGRLKGGKAKAALAWIKATTGLDDVPAEWVRLDWEGYRIAWRDICRNSDKRTLIAAILPPGVGVSHKAPTIRPFRLAVHENGVENPLQYELPVLLYLAGVLSSFACDSIARSRVAKTTLSANTFCNFNIPPWQGGGVHRRIAELAALLTCQPPDEGRPWAAYGELAASVGLSVEDALIDPASRQEAEAELNAHVASLYRLGREEFAFLMNELFMTSQHKEEHTIMRDTILGMMEPPTD